MARRTVPPAGLVTLDAIVGTRRAPKQSAAAAALELAQRIARLTPSERSSASLQAGPAAVRAEVRPMAPGTLPGHVKAAVASGALPEPVRGPWGSACPIEAVETWAASRA
jgi:hypothetical protein